MDKKRPYKRRKFFVKQWLQLRYMLLLGSSTVVGGIIFGLVMKHSLKEKIYIEMYRPHSKIQSLWEILYPDVMRLTLILFVCSVTVLFLLLQLFSYRINRASRELADHVDRVIETPDSEVEPVQVSVREFSDFGREVDGLITFYRRRWDVISEKARTGSVICETLEASEEDVDRNITYVELLRHLESTTRLVRWEAEKRDQ